MKKTKSAPIKTNIRQIKKWAAQFSSQEWETLCTNQEFLDVIMDNLQKASEIAESILKKDIKINN